MGNPKILFYLGCKTTLRFEPVSFKCTSRNSSVLLVSGLKSIPRYWINGSDRLLFLLRGSSLHPPLFSSSAARKVHFGQSCGDAACPSSFHRRRPTSLRRHSSQWNTTGVEPTTLGKSRLPVWPVKTKRAPRALLRLIKDRRNLEVSAKTRPN